MFHTGNHDNNNNWTEWLRIVCREIIIIIIIEVALKIVYQHFGYLDGWMVSVFCWFVCLLVINRLNSNNFKVCVYVRDDYLTWG